MSENYPQKCALLAAGGTGGHLFPAQALAGELKRKGWKIHLATDSRGQQFLGDFKAEKQMIFNSASLNPKRPVQAVGGLWKLAQGYWNARRYLLDEKPDIVIGFGGYPSVPPVLAAQHLTVPTILHEQNAIMGRANKLLARKAKVTALGLPLAAGQDTICPTVLTGNPLRDAVIEAAQIPYIPPQKGEALKLLVFGGSLGASIFSQIVPQAIASLKQDYNIKLIITQQCRKEDIAHVGQFYKDNDIIANISPFFSDMPAQIAQSHLVICRSGASTLSELTAIGRPAILVPFAASLDQDQAANARILADNDAAHILYEQEFTSQRLVQTIIYLLEQQHLPTLATHAKTLGQPKATQNLAQLAVHIATTGNVQDCYQESAT